MDTNVVSNGNSFFDFANNTGVSVKVDVRLEGTEVLFRASDVAICLGYANPANFVELLGIDNLAKRDVIDAIGRVRQVPFLTEKQLYKGVLKSCAPNAEPFQDWVCGTVLPSIRKTGSYSATPMSPLDILEAQVAIMKEQNKKIGQIELKLSAIEASVASKVNGDEERLSASQVATLENLMNDWYRKGGRKGWLKGKMMSAMKTNFLGCAASTCTYKDIAQKHFEDCVKLVNRMGQDLQGASL